MRRDLALSLDERRAAKLDRLADRADVSDGSLAQSLLCTAIDRADPDSAEITEILAGVEGIHEHLSRAEDEVARGATIALRDL